MKKMLLLMMCCLAVAFISCQPDRTITASADPANGGTITGTGTYSNGETCTLTATPNNGYIFVNWTENGNELTTNNKYSFEATADRHLVAHFMVQQPDNHQFIGSYTGSIVLNGTLSVPNAPQYSMPLDGLTIDLSAVITPGSTEDIVHVVFTMNKEDYETDAAVSGNSIDFGVLSYNYKENNGSDVMIQMTPTSFLEGNTINMAGPFEGVGQATFPDVPIPVPLTANGNFTGMLTKVTHSSK